MSNKIERPDFDSVDKVVAFVNVINDREELLQDPAHPEVPFDNSVG